LAGGWWRRRPGNVVVPWCRIALNSHAGTRYGIPSPCWRVPRWRVGANLPALLRGLVACGWFGIQTWIGGWAIYKLIEVLWPGIGDAAAAAAAFVGLKHRRVLCFMIFWAMNVWIVLRGMDSIKFSGRPGARLSCSPLELRCSFGPRCALGVSARCWRTRAVRR